MSGIEGVSHEAPSSRSGRRRRRSAMVLTLALGLGGSSAATGFAVTGVESRGLSALDGQAGLPAVGDAPRLAARPGGATPPGDAVPGAGDGTTRASFSLQEARQLVAGRSDGELPFTGRAAIPVLLTGLADAGVGFLVRRA